MMDSPYDKNSDNISNDGCFNGDGCFGGRGGGSGWLKRGNSGNGGSFVYQRTREPATPTTFTTTTTDSTIDPTVVVTNELNKLSIQERGIVYEDLHGISSSMNMESIEQESNIEFVNQCIYDMKLQIQYKIPNSSKVAYMLAMEEYGSVGKEFCNDSSLLVLFLRADRWDTKKAALRFVGWLNWKLQLFGRELLCHRHITLDKLDTETIQTIQSGRTQILPERDTSGRTILFDWFGQRSKCFKSIKGMIIQFWYTMMASIEDDIQTQQNGIVYVVYTLDGLGVSSSSFNANDRECLVTCSQMAPMLPVRFCSVHYCFNDPIISPIMSLAQMAVDSHIRTRFRKHEGNHTEVQYSLMTYGIPCDVLPVTTNGEIQTKHHLKWFKRRMIRDSVVSNRIGGGRNQDFYGIDLPGRYDVLLGKGKPIQRHFGNRRLQELISTYFDVYEHAQRGEKQIIAEKIVAMVATVTTATTTTHQGLSSSSTNRVPTASVGSGGGGGGVVVGSGTPRFLKRRDDGWWEPISNEDAIEKVGHSFRAFRFSYGKKPTNNVTGTTNKGTIQASSSSSSSTTTTTAAAVGRSSSSSATATKRIKVETTQGARKQESCLLTLPESSLSMQEDRDEQQRVLGSTSSRATNCPNDGTATTTEDEWLDMDRFDWGI